MKKMMENTSGNKKKKNIILYFSGSIAVIFALMLIIISQILHVPEDYRPIVPENEGEISLLLTNKILPEIYNNSQLEEAFEIELSEQQVNVIISDIPLKLDDSLFRNPCVKLDNGVVKFMFNSSLAGLTGVITADLQVEKNMLGLGKIRIGRLNCTKLLKNKINKVIKNSRLAKDEKTASFLREMMTSSAEIPPFKVDKNWLKVEDIKVSDGSMKILFKPQGRKIIKVVENANFHN